MTFPFRLGFCLNPQSFYTSTGVLSRCDGPVVFFGGVLWEEGGGSHIYIYVYICICE